jgi:hypothetical protein
MPRRFSSPSGLAIVWDPGRGAKITSLRDPHGREWLVQSSAPIPPPLTPFGLAEMAGWDECAPTITACRVNGTPLPDHGDVWDVAWNDHDGAVVVDGPSWPYRLRRVVGPSSSGGIRLTYEASATHEVIPFLWAAHPQFSAPPGTRVVLDHDPATVVDVLTDGFPEAPWGPLTAAIDDVGAGRCRKVYLPPEHAVDSARLEREDGSTLNLRWSPECRYLGLWLDNAAYSDEPVIAIEPSLAFADSLEAAITIGRAPVIEPGVPLTWWVELDAWRRPPARSE